jgi:predicted porin
MHIARTAGRLLVPLALLLLARRADAAFELGSKDGWNLTIGGFVNGFLTIESGDASPAGHADLYSRPVTDMVTRIRQGFLPSLIGFTASAPEVDGIKVGARVGIYPHINTAAGARTNDYTFIDVRELNFTLDGKFGQVLVGRALALFEAKNVLNDISLFGVGHPSPFAFDQGPTLGHIGTGYTYPAFVAQMRYTTPDMSGFKLAVAAVDPAAPQAGAVLKTPTLEGELSYGGKSGSTSYSLFASGVYQSSKLASEKSVSSSGVAGGATVGFSGLDLLASGMYGSGIGNTGVINAPADFNGPFDSADKPRTDVAFMVQAAYTIKKVKLGANFSQLARTKTDADKATNAVIIDTRQAFTGGIYYDIIPSVKLVAEYTHLQVKWTDDAKQSSDTIGLGGFLFF